MKSIKSFSLAAVVTLVAMTCVGTSSAMAQLAKCANDESLCASPLTHTHELSVGKANITTLIGVTVQCNYLFLGDALLVGGRALSSPLIFHGSLTYLSCGECTVTEENGPAEIKFSATGHETAEVTGEFLLHVQCSGFMDCSYNGVGLKGTAKGALLSTQENGEVTFVEKALTKEAGGFLCPKGATLTLTSTGLSKTYWAT